jgi:hypothetical protein
MVGVETDAQGDKEKRSGQPAMNRSKQGPVWLEKLSLSFGWWL